MLAPESPARLFVMLRKALDQRCEARRPGSPQGEIAFSKLLANALHLRCRGVTDAIDRKKDRVGS